MEVKEFILEDCSDLKEKIKKLSIQRTLLLNMLNKEEDSLRNKAQKNFTETLSKKESILLSLPFKGCGHENVLIHIFQEYLEIDYNPETQKLNCIFSDNISILISAEEVLKIFNSKAEAEKTGMNIMQKFGFNNKQINISFWTPEDSEELFSIDTFLED